MIAMNVTGMQRRTEYLTKNLFKVVLWLWTEKSGKSRRLIKQQTFANLADFRIKAATPGRSVFRRFKCNQDKEIR